MEETWLKFKVSFKYLLGGIKICREKSQYVLLIKSLSYKTLYHRQTDQEHLLLTALFVKNHQLQLTTKNDSSKKRQCHRTICQLLQTTNQKQVKTITRNSLRSRQRDL
jgi:hypothetical protein